MLNRHFDKAKRYKKKLYYYLTYLAIDWIILLIALIKKILLVAVQLEMLKAFDF